MKKIEYFKNLKLVQVIINNMSEEELKDFLRDISDKYTDIDVHNKKQLTSIS